MHNKEIRLGLQCPSSFCNIAHSLRSSLQTELNLGYLDDITLGGLVYTVASDVAEIASYRAAANTVNISSVYTRILITAENNNIKQISILIEYILAPDGFVRTNRRSIAWYSSVLSVRLSVCLGQRQTFIAIMAAKKLDW